jgi:hypothetical protein
MADSETDPIADPIEAPSFAIPLRPERRYSRRGGLSYEGTTVFVLTPDSVPGDADIDPDARLCALVEGVLGADPYTYGDWFDLPMPVFLVHDRETRDVFRVAVRDGRIEFHVLPETDSRGLSALYDRLCDATSGDGTSGEDGTDGEIGALEPALDGADVTWRVACRTDADR